MESTFSRTFLKNRLLAAGTPRGFTLVEMMVVIAIIGVVLTITILGQSSFNRTLLLTDTVYTVALSIRDAQSLGLSSQNFNSAANTGYGVNFTTQFKNLYYLFADTYPSSPGSSLSGLCPGHLVSSGPEARPGDCLNTSSAEIVNTYTFSRGYTISKFCGTTSVGTQRCYTQSGDGYLTITFLRPNTESVIIGTLADGVTHETYTQGTINISDSTGVTKCVIVYQTGQVSVSSTCP